MKKTHHVLGLWLLVALIIAIAGCSNIQHIAPEEIGTLEPQELGTRVGSVSGAFTFLQPLAAGSASPEDFDTSLTDMLTVEVCDVAGDECVLIATFDADGHGEQRLRLEDDQFYMVNWNTQHADLATNSTQRIQVLVAGLEIGSLDVTPEVRGDLSRTWPIRFHVENHPVIRVRILNEQGFTAPEVAQVLLDEFGLNAHDTAQLLADDLDPCTSSEIALALKDVYEQTANETAAILKNLGFNVHEVTTALDEVFELTEGPIAVALEKAGFTASEITDAFDEVLELFVDAIIVALELAGFTADEITNAFVTTITQVGQVNEIGHEFGTYQLYVPHSHTADSKVVLVVHGTPGENQDVVALAETFINRWLNFAETTGVVIVSLAFDQLNFASHEGAFGGYRGLYGRVVGADEFLHSVFDQIGSITPVPTTERRFLLYGHSAGGQFASRYVVRHPNRVLAAVLSAPGRYAFPDATATWHFGMGSIQREIFWELADERTLIDITPDPEGWVKAATLPITVVIGDQDLDQLACIPAQCDPSWGSTATRIDISRRWVDEMNALAADNDREGRTRFVLIPGVGHNSAALTDDSQKAFTPSVPDVTGMGEHQAMAVLQEAALRGQVGQRRLSHLPKGDVISQAPTANTVVFIESRVFLHVSLGVREPPELHLIPNVVGMSNEDATVALRAEGFTVTVAFADDDHPFGEVIGQQPEAGTPVSLEKEMHLIASLGPGPQ